MTKYASRKKIDFILSEESAIDQVRDLLDYYDIDVEVISDEDVKANFERALDAITRHIRTGALEVVRAQDGKLNVIQTTTGGEKLTYAELGAKHKLQMDRVSRSESYRRIYALMGSLCGMGSGAIEKLGARDLSVVEVLGTVFTNA